jgi:hypothetical protein
VVEGILFFFLGGAVAGVVCGAAASMSTGDSGYAFGLPAVFVIVLVASGLIPFASLAAMLRNRWPASKLKRAGFFTGLVLIPSVVGLDRALAQVDAGLQSCSGPWKPFCSLGASTAVVAVCFVVIWAVGVIARLKGRRSEA